MIYITLEQYSMGRDVMFPHEWAIAKPNAIALLALVNAFLMEIAPPFPIVVSSGFRPEALNNVIPSASKTSLHMLGKAVDIEDVHSTFKYFFTPVTNPAHAELLRKHGLFMEHPQFTPDWVHLDCGNRLDRATRTFRPA